MIRRTWLTQVGILSNSTRSWVGRRRERSPAAGRSGRLSVGPLAETPTASRDGNRRWPDLGARGVGGGSVADHQAGRHQRNPPPGCSAIPLAHPTHLAHHLRELHERGPGRKPSAEQRPGLRRWQPHCPALNEYRHAFGTNPPSVSVRSLIQAWMHTRDFPHTRERPRRVPAAALPAARAAATASEQFAILSLVNAWFSNRPFPHPRGGLGRLQTLHHRGQASRPAASGLHLRRECPPGRRARPAHPHRFVRQRLVQQPGSLAGSSRPATIVRPVASCRRTLRPSPSPAPVRSGAASAHTRAASAASIGPATAGQTLGQQAKIWPLFSCSFGTPG